MLNLYHHGGEGMAWHSDDEKILKRHASIASVSLGVERKFSFRPKENKETRSVILEHGSLLVMKEETQTHWQHMVPKTTNVKEH
ncbi:MAG: alpha-ketoglutarate-dependent dioxygenase AlkB [Luteolibacter sp.]